MMEAIRSADPDAAPRFSLTLVSETDGQSFAVGAGSDPVDLRPGRGGNEGNRGRAAQRILNLPLMPRPEGRLVQTIDTRTAVFGDPAYDRRLGSPANAAVLVVDGPTSRLDWVFGLGSHGI